MGVFQLFGGRSGDYQDLGHCPLFDFYGWPWNCQGLSFHLLACCCCCSLVKSCPALCNPMDCSILGSLSFTITQSLLRLMSTESVMPSNHLILCYSLLHLPSIFPSIRVFCRESALRIRWPKYGTSTAAEVLPVRIQGWFPLGLTGLISLQTKGLSRVFSSTTIRKHQFFGAQPSLPSNSHIHSYMTTGKTTALTTQNFVSKVMYLLFNMLSRSVIAFLPRKTC